jgi:hypothetical protein
MVFVLPVDGVMGVLLLCINTYKLGVFVSNQSKKSGRVVVEVVEVSEARSIGAELLDIIVLYVLGFQLFTYTHVE